ncbi:MAG: type II secretion system minor pseudopilin GspK [Desulfobacterales bacterium]|jgi:general secretion pathway protein K
MAATRSSRERGIALLMTLGFITLAISIAVETNRQARLAIETTDAMRARMVAGQMAAAGIHGAMAILIQDRYASETDHLKETWADAEKLQEALQAVGFEDGRLEVRIMDEMARVQINALVDFPQSRSFVPQQQQVMERAIDQVRRELETQGDLSAADMVNAIKDWLDTGDDEAITGLNGAESDYYQSLNPPYTARNGPMIHIGELARVKGISSELFQGQGETIGLRDLMTVYGTTPLAAGRFTFSGKINLNTAAQPVLAALMPPESSDLAEAFIQFRNEADALVLESRVWYQDVPGAAGLELSADLVTLSSNIFRIQATAAHDGFERAVTAVVERRMATDGQGWACRILAWEMS